MCVRALLIMCPWGEESDAWRKGGTSEGEPVGCNPFRFVIVVLDDSLCFGVTGEVRSAKNLLFHNGSDECRCKPAVSTCVGVGNNRVSVAARCTTRKLC